MATYEIEVRVTARWFVQVDASDASDARDGFQEAFGNDAETIVAEGLASGDDAIVEVLDVQEVS